MPQKKEFYKAAEVAKVMNVPTRIVHNWIRQGRLKAKKSPSNTWLISAAEMQRFRRMGEVGRTKGML